MRKIKYLTFAIIIVLLSLYLYENFIYYRFPFNPIKEYTSEPNIDFYFSRNLPNGEGITTKCQHANTCGLVLEYLSDLNLMPLKDNAAQGMLKYGNVTYFTGMLKFNESDKIFISDISIDTPNILRIYSPINGFKGGYYKIMDSKFDYNYIYNLTGDTEE
ncbi:hypothetical protein [Sporosarcina koreensis]|uniref:Lipoprotein n=1 Tax=Sporosarcina koreensis TaxID=334735 RepID=A0ABW0TZS9_9BACL